MRHLRIAAALGLAVAVVTACSGPAPVATGQDPAQAYLALASAYNQVLTDTNAELSSGQVAGAFARLAVAERTFGTGLAAIKFPPNAAGPAQRLETASHTLESLYNAATRAPTEAEQTTVLDQIAAARASSSQAAADLRRALGLPAP
jgi:hypothetical protein